MFSSRAEKIATIAREIEHVNAALQKRSTLFLQSAMTSLERALEGVAVEGKGEDVVRAGLNALATARPELAKLRAAENQLLDAKRQAHLQKIAQPCRQCGGSDIFVGEGAQIIVSGHHTEQISDEQLVCNVLVCASCGDVRMVANLADVATQRFFHRTTAIGATPYR